jgi:hypothetical protein
MNPYTPSAEQQQANDEALARAIALIYQPLTREQQRQVDRDAARARGLLAWDRMREQGRP